MARTGKRGLTARGSALRWLTLHRGCTEQPANSNTDARADGIRAAQRRLGAWLIGLAWCGVWAANALLAAGVQGVSYRLASVSLIEDDARAGAAPFRDWLEPTLANLRRCLRGDLVVWFGRGVHVGTIRAFKFVRGVGWVIISEEGNTSFGTEGSQSNGGVSCRRERALDQAHGFARVDFPGGPGRGRRLGGAARLIAGSVYAQGVGTLFGHDVLPGEQHAEIDRAVGYVPSDAVLQEQLLQRMWQPDRLGFPRDAEALLAEL